MSDLYSKLIKLKISFTYIKYLKSKNTIYLKGISNEK